MVAENKMESDKYGGPPPIDTKDVVSWAKRIKMFLMKKKRNHIGLEPHGLVRPPNNAPAAAKESFQVKSKPGKKGKIRVLVQFTMQSLTMGRR